MENERIKVIEPQRVGILEKIRLWWKFDGQYMHKEFARGVKNLWRWLPIIWKDRDWDHVYIYRIIEAKLEFQANYISKFGNHVEADRDAERMRLVVKLMKRQEEDFYTSEYLDYCESKLSFKEVPKDNDIYETVKDETLYEMISEELYENFDDYFKKYPRQYKRVMAGELDKFNRDNEEIEKKVIAMEIAYANQERCKKLIFKIMSDHIERWWD